MVAEPTLAGAASVAGVGERTLSRWLSTDATFQEEYRKLQRETLAAAAHELTKAAVGAVSTLAGIMDNSTAPPATRVRAAQVILEMAFENVKLDDLVCRIDALESLISERGYHHVNGRH